MTRSGALSSNLDVAISYAKGLISGTIKANKYRVKCAERFMNDLEDPSLEVRTKDADFIIRIIETQLQHMQGEDLQGHPLRGTPFLLTDYHKFIICGAFVFFHKGTDIRKYKEMFVYMPRKNVKTTFIAALAWAVGLLNRRSGSTIYIVAASLKQSLQSFNFLKFNVERLMADEEEDSYRILDNNNEHSIEVNFDDGMLRIEALAANPDVQDSFNCNFAIADELHAFKKPKQYTLFKDAQKTYTNKMMVGITTAGDNMNSFCYRRLQHAKKVLDGVVNDAELFIFLCEADEDEFGNIDYTNPEVHEIANPGYGSIIRPSDILSDSITAQNDPQLRKDFLAKSLNVYTSSMKAYFNIDEFRKSDEQYNWTFAELIKKHSKWYGGADLSKLHDLTTSALVTEIDDVLCIMTHGWFPIVKAKEKAEEDAIPLFGWKDDGWLDMCNDPAINTDEVVNWFIRQRKGGCRVRQIGHDRKFARKYYVEMKKKGFNVVDQPQYFYKKSEGFRYIEEKAKKGQLYYFHSEAYEYCVMNVRAIEKTDDMIQYEKVEPSMRIDYFDASVFAVIRMLEDLESQGKLNRWFNAED